MGKISSVFLMIVLWSFQVFATEDLLVPIETLQAFVKQYSPSEKEAIERDRKNIRDLSFAQAKNGQKQLIYLATAGGPGASKTTILEEYLSNNPGFVYVDPDQRGLKFMINTYLQQVNNFLFSKSISHHSFLEKAYIQWRGASNYIASSILNDAYKERLAIAHGTTSTSKTVGALYKKLKAKGYKIILLMCNSPEKNRFKAIEHRERHQYFVQSSHDDFVQKGDKFFENFPLYFELADEIQFFWIENYSRGWVKVGDYSRTDGFKLYRYQDFEKFKNSYEAYRMQHPKKQLPSFDTFIDKFDK